MLFKQNLFSDTNLLLMTDSYKISHDSLYKNGLEYMYSYFSSRGGEFENIPFFGLQYYVIKYLCGKVVTQEKIEEYKNVCKEHLGFYSDKWRELLNDYDGYLPIRIKSVLEGSVVGPHNVLFTVENTDPKYAFLTSYLETLLVKMWYPLTVSAQSFYIKNIMQEYFERSGNLDGLEYRLHDFGYRGVSSEETAAIGAASHLLHFSGTDSIAGILMLQKYYNSDIFGKSVPATEHSVATLWGQDEIGYLKNCLKQYPEGVISIVCDSYNQFKFIKELIAMEKDNILNRNGVVTIRLDSGDPRESVIKALNILEGIFGSNTNSKGYKVLPDQIRLLQGDGISRYSIPEIYNYMLDNKWSVDNIYLGSGGALLQKLDRDTNRFAYKASNAVVNGESVDIQKNPLGDPTKKSMKGRLKLIYDTKYQTVSESTSGVDCLETIFENGELTRFQDFDSIRANLKRHSN